MAPPSPARLYATVAGALLIVLGLAGFFFDLGWLNFFHVAAGAAGLLLASAAPRFFALLAGLVLIGLAAWGLAEGEAWMQWLHLSLGLLGLAAYAGSEPRAQAATESA
jgi:hypothetical protein